VSGSVWDAWLAGPAETDCQECGAAVGERCSKECRFNKGLPTGEGRGL
jgi:hypothetical protein